MVQAPEHLQVLEAAQVLVDGRVLAGQADSRAELAGVLDDVEAGDARRAAVRRQEGGENADGGRLARPVGAEKPEDAARLDAEVDLVEGDDVAVTLPQAVGLDRGSPRHDPHATESDQADGLGRPSPVVPRAPERS